MDLDAYLQAIGVGPVEEHEAELAVRHIRSPAQVLRRPSTDILSILAPQRPMELRVASRGRVTHHVMRHGEIQLMPPFTEVDYAFGPIDAVMAWIPRATATAAAQAIDPEGGRDVVFRMVYQVRDPLLSSLAAELCDARQHQSSAAAAKASGVTGSPATGSAATGGGATGGAPDGGLTGGVTGGAAARPSRCRYVDALTTAFLGRIIRRYGRRHTEARNWGTSIHDDTIRRTLAYLDRHLAEDIGVESAARHVGLSQQHFADIFKTATGETVWQHVRRRRLQRGRDMLGGTTLSVEEVARQVGYASASHFATAFKSMFGQPPGSYRTDALGKGDHGRKAVGGKAES